MFTQERINSAIQLPLWTLNRCLALFRPYTPWTAVFRRNLSVRLLLSSPIACNQMRPATALCSPRRHHLWHGDVRLIVVLVCFADNESNNLLLRSRRLRVSRP